MVLTAGSFKVQRPRKEFRQPIRTLKQHSPPFSVAKRKVNLPS